MTDEITITTAADDATAAYEIDYGLDRAVLMGLSAGQKAQVALLMARAAERSYRRGFQQGASFALERPDVLPPDLHDWRYGSTTDLSPWGDSDRGETSLRRLHIENDCLARLGFPSSELEGEYDLFVWPPKVLRD